MPGPLAGIRVVDCSRGTAGTRATGLFADYGADVVWVEPPGGDPLRSQLAVPYSVYNRGKRSIELDVRDEAARDSLIELASRADVFVESWRPGVAEQLGLGYDVLHARSPGLVYCSISGFGVVGPLRDVPAREALVHALVGVMAEQVGVREGPIYEGLPFAGFGAAYLAVIGVLAALYRRGSDGVGRHVETSLLDGALSYLSMGWIDTDLGQAPLAPGNMRLIASTFVCGDGEYLGVHTGAVGAFGRLMDVLGFSDDIPSNADGIDMGILLTPEQKEFIDANIHAIFATKPRSVWLEQLRAADVCAIPYLRPGEVFDEPQPAYNQMIAEIDDPVLGPVSQVALAAKFSETPGTIGRPAPRAGEHTEAVLAELREVVSPPAAGAVGLPDDRPLLEGVKILDLGAYYAGPYASRLLADLGADVIKLEPMAGDPVRGLERVFRSAQAGKRSIAANLKDEALTRGARKLMEWADIVHHNMRPGAAERLGIGYEQVRALNPRVVYLYAPGWGSSGPDMLRQSFAPLMSGYVGVGFEVAGQYNPPLFPVGNEDPGAGLQAAIGMLMALVHRQRKGVGQLVEVTQLDATMAHVAHIVRTPAGEVVGAGLLDPVQLGVGPLDRLYETADGWLCLVATQPAEIAALGTVVGIDLLGDERFATAESRAANDYALAALLAESLRARRTEEWLDAFVSAGVPAAEPVPHNTVAFLRDPENHRTGRVAELPHPTQGRVREMGVLLRVSDAEVVPHRGAPGLGEHTDEILRWLGYDVAEIAKLRARGVAR